jgi:RNase P subunit RPR2
MIRPGLTVLVGTRADDTHPTVLRLLGEHARRIPCAGCGAGLALGPACRRAVDAGLVQAVCVECAEAGQARTAGERN